MRNYDNDASLSDAHEVVGYSRATPVDPRIRVLLSGSGASRSDAEVIGLDFDGDTNTLDVIVRVDA